MLATATMHSMISWRMFAAIGFNKLMGKRDGLPFSPQISFKIEEPRSKLRRMRSLLRFRQRYDLGTFKSVSGFFTPFDWQFAAAAESDQ